MELFIAQALECLHLIEYFAVYLLSEMICGKFFAKKFPFHYIIFNEI